VRRKDREITDRSEIEAILNEAMVCRIGLADQNGPYIVPVCFGYEDGSVYIHSAPEGKKLAMLAKDSRCCFEVDICDRVIRGDRPCSWGMRYRSVMGYGRAEILADPDGKRHGLNCIMHHYHGSTHEFSGQDLESVIVVRIVLESMTGKKHD
jgi:nitroimidazol reductase NimA-like FMN-containing flavoprotein (pyridoxamine 5'-phosphate oxidase superfamily)